MIAYRTLHTAGEARRYYAAWLYATHWHQCAADDGNPQRHLYCDDASDPSPAASAAATASFAATGCQAREAFLCLIGSLAISPSFLGKQRRSWATLPVASSHIENRMASLPPV